MSNKILQSLKSLNCFSSELSDFNTGKKNIGQSTPKNSSDALKKNDTFNSNKKLYYKEVNLLSGKYAEAASTKINNENFQFYKDFSRIISFMIENEKKDREVEEYNRSLSNPENGDCYFRATEPSIKGDVRYNVESQSGMRHYPEWQIVSELKRILISQYQYIELKNYTSSKELVKEYFESVSEINKNLRETILRLLNTSSSSYPS